MALPSAASKLASITSEGLTWTDLTDPVPGDIASLASQHSFHPLDMGDVFTKRQLTKVEDHGEHMFVCLLIPAPDSKGTIVSRHLSMFIGKDFLVTLHPSNLDAVTQMFQRCQGDDRARAELMKSSAFLAYRIIDALMDGLFGILDDVQAGLDRIEEVVFSEKKSTAVAINATRRQIAVLRRMIYPLQLFLPDLAKAQKFSRDDLSIYFSDERHKIGKISRMLDAMKEMVEIFNDTDYVTSSNRTNTILAILTIVFTLTLPATVISGLYGMNVPLPGGLVPGPLEFLGPFTSIAIIFAVMLAATSLMAIYFKRAGWF